MVAAVTAVVHGVASDAMIVDALWRWRWALADACARDLTRTRAQVLGRSALLSVAPAASPDVDCSLLWGATRIYTRYAMQRKKIAIPNRTPRLLLHRRSASAPELKAYDREQQRVAIFSTSKSRV